MTNTKVEINSDDYHDYVIKDGRLVGEFEQMYQKAKDVPWHQDKQEDWDDVRLTSQMLKEFGPFDHIIDFASGLGYYLDVLSRSNGKPDCSLTGFDISETCCRKGKELFPAIDFQIADLMNATSHYDVKREPEDNSLFVLRGSLWYLFPEMENVIKNMYKTLQERDILAIVQNFPSLDEPFVGKEVIPSPEILVKLFEKKFQLVNKASCDDPSGGYNHWFIGLFEK